MRGRRDNGGIAKQEGEEEYTTIQKMPLCECSSVSTFLYGELDMFLAANYVPNGKFLKVSEGCPMI